MSLAQFLRACWPIIEPSTPLTWNWHLAAICDHVQALLEGKLGKQNLLITIPPGTLKSSIVSVAAPAWRWINAPHERMVFASGTASVAARDSLRCRAILDSSWYRATFAISWEFAGDQNQKLLYETSATGYRAATTTG